MELTWGEVIALSPLTVRFAGDSADTPVTLKASGLTLATNDKVALARLGATSGWCVMFKVVAS